MDSRHLYQLGAGAALLVALCFVWGCSSDSDEQPPTDAPTPSESSQAAAATATATAGPTRLETQSSIELVEPGPFASGTSLIARFGEGTQISSSWTLEIPRPEGAGWQPTHLIRMPEGTVDLIEPGQPFVTGISPPQAGPADIPLPIPDDAAAGPARLCNWVTAPPPGNLCVEFEISP